MKVQSVASPTATGYLVYFRRWRQMAGERGAAQIWLVLWGYPGRGSE